MQIGNEIVKIAVMSLVTHVDERGIRRVNGDETEAERAKPVLPLQTGNWRGGGRGDAARD